MADRDLQVSSTSSSSAAASAAFYAAPARPSAAAEIDEIFDNLLESSLNSSSMSSNARTSVRAAAESSSSSAGTQAYDDQFVVESRIAEDVVQESKVKPRSYDQGDQSAASTMFCPAVLPSASRGDALGLQRGEGMESPRPSGPGPLLVGRVLETTAGSIPGPSVTSSDPGEVARQNSDSAHVSASGGASDMICLGGSSAGRGDVEAVQRGEGMESHCPSGPGPLLVGRVCATTAGSIPAAEITSVRSLEPTRQTKDSPQQHYDQISGG